MKKLTILLALLMLTISTVGCGCTRRIRDRLCRGAFCGPAAVAAPAAAAQPSFAAQAPMMSPMMSPTQQPVMQQAPIVMQQAPMMMQQAPMMMAPQMMNNCCPCDPCCIPCDPCCDPCSCGYGGFSGSGYGGMPMQGGMSDSGWSTGCGCGDGGYSSGGYSSGEGFVEQPTPSSAGSPSDPAPTANDRSL